MDLLNCLRMVADREKEIKSNAKRTEYSRTLQDNISFQWLSYRFRFNMNYYKMGES